MVIEKEMLKGYIDVILLALLRAQDFYGYELGRRVKTMTGDSFELKEATLYLAFKRLEQNGYISSYWGDESEGGRRKYYTMTANGRAHLTHKRNEWEHIKKVMDLFLEEV